MVDSLGIIEADLTRARQAHNVAVGGLHRNGAPGVDRAYCDRHCRPGELQSYRATCLSAS